MMMLPRLTRREGQFFALAFIVGTLALFIGAIASTAGLLYLMIRGAIAVWGS